jgi:hypothetical protein
MTAATRAVATRQEVMHADSVGSTVVTAEIPAVPVHRSYGVLLPDGSVWYPDSKRRLPAPWPLRFFVWVLALLLLLMLAGLAVVEWHPSWLAALRHTVGTAPTVQVGGQTTLPGGSTPGTTTGSTSPASGTNRCVATSATAQTCTLSASSYKITFTTTQAVSVEVKSLSTGAVIYSATQPGGQSHTIPVTGAATLVAAAKWGSFKVTQGGTTLIPSMPAAYEVVYTFQPAGT